MTHDQERRILLAKILRIPLHNRGFPAGSSQPAEAVTDAALSVQADDLDQQCSLQ